MKKATYCLVYLAVLVIGVLLLIFNRDATTAEVPETMRGLVLAGGILFLLGGAVGAVSSAWPKKDAEGVMVTKPWYMTVMWIGSIFWGVLTVIFNPLFTAQLCLTLGVDLILAGLASGMWIVTASRPYGAAGWWYVAPFATIGAGIVDLTLIGDYATLGGSNATAAILSGILLILLGVNGLISLNRRKRVEKETIESVNEIAGRDKK